MWLQRVPELQKIDPHLSEPSPPCPCLETVKNPFHCPSFPRSTHQFDPVESLDVVRLPRLPVRRDYLPNSAVEIASRSNWVVDNSLVEVRWRSRRCQGSVHGRNVRKCCAIWRVWSHNGFGLSVNSTNGWKDKPAA